MKVTALSFIPPIGAEDNPKVTPELCASILAKYSRSNEGLENILAKVDLTDPEKSIKAIFKFVDYGHASIGGLTGSIPIALDGVTMWLAFKILELSAYADAQESSTRYITMSAENLASASTLGFNPSDAERVDAFGRLALATYQEEYARLDKLASEQPHLIRYPEKADAKMRDRIRKNFALDRARYFLPMFLRTNVAVVQTARAWTDVIAGLLSLPQPEAQTAGERLIEALRPYAPNLIRHARRKNGWVAAALDETLRAKRHLKISHAEHPDSVSLTHHGFPHLTDDLRHRENRYDRCGLSTRLSTIEVIWDGMALAEARDLNRHRTGSRFYETTHKGFYIPEEVRKGINPKSLLTFTKAHSEVLRIASEASVGEINAALLPYALVLGSQSAFYRSTTLDKFVYEAELRTGPGSHFRYADHYRKAVDALNRQLPASYRKAIILGEAEPE